MDENNKNSENSGNKNSGNDDDGTKSVVLNLEKLSKEYDIVLIKLYSLSIFLVI